ncbi:MAG TPA: iron ABC transporter ATP-binding protein [Leifsonia sp.]|jgi:hypothetical protein|nr:iron ABC transporter ATP-binding protein [Leifsonia sp.]
MVEPSRLRRVTVLRASAAVAAVLTGSLALTGCVGDDKRAGGATPLATRSSTPIAAPTPTPTPSDPPTPVTLTCPQIVTPDQFYAFNPNFGTDPGYAPKSGTLQQKIVDWKGVSCGWSNQTSHDVIEIAIGQPPASAMEGLKNAAITSSKPVPTYGVPPQVEGYFKPGTAGEVQMFTGKYWVVATSTAFFEPGDPAPLMANVLANLPKN